MAGTKRSTGGGKNKADKTGRPRIKSSHATGGPPRGAAKPAAKSARSRAQKVVGEVTRAASRPTAAGAAASASAEGAPKARKTKALLEGGTTSSASQAARELAIMVAIEALEKKAVGLEILDVAGRVDYADFLVLMSGRSDRHVVALAQGIEEALKKKGQRPISVEGLPHATWVLIDYSDVVVHVFQEDHRHLYNLEGLWMDARRIPLPAEDRPN